MGARLGAVKRRKKSVEITAGLTSESNGFFLFRKRNPIEQLEQRKAHRHTAADGSGQDAETTAASEDPDNSSSDPAQ
jgi:hypothetical protein